MKPDSAMAILDIAARLAAAAHPKLGGDMKAMFRDLVAVVEGELHRLAPEHRAGRAEPGDRD
jgi:hypothetical protein